MKFLINALKAINTLLATGLTAMLVGIVFMAGFYIYLDDRLPAIEPDAWLPGGPLRIYTQDGQLLRQYGRNSLPVDYDALPDEVVNAFIAAEDDRFFEHGGVDIKGLVRAALVLLKTGRKVEGGSTITMQLARNLYLTPKRTYERKVKEILLSFKLERNLSKEKILELYLNRIYLGSRAYGIGAAAQTYFDTGVENLSLSQAAMLAGLPKAPSDYTPLRHPEKAKARRRYVLGRMVYLGFISRREYGHALDAEVASPAAKKRQSAGGGYVAEMARRKMVQHYGEDAYRLGLNVYTTVSSQQQKAAQQAVHDQLLAFDARHEWRRPQLQLTAEEMADAQQRQAILQKQTVLGLEPALVLAAQGQQIQVERVGGEHLTLGARQNPWIDRMGSAAAMVKKGDIVWLNEVSPNHWQLAQIPQVEGALVALNSGTGAIEALVGGFDFNQSQFNRATSAYRQTGSAIKPFIYAAALANQFTAASLINDAPVVYGDDDAEDAEEEAWRPENYGRRVYGPTRLRDGLVYSRNLMTIRLLDLVGISKGIRYLTQFGLAEKRMPHDLTLSLGSVALTPMQLARAYAVIANGGYLVNPFLIEKIIDGRGRTLYQAEPQRACQPDLGCWPEEYARNNAQDNERWAKQAIDPSIAYIIRDMLQDVVKRGTGRRARALGRSDVGGKTGTTNNTVDAWFAGFGGQLVTINWVGFDAPLTLGAYETGARAALPTWVQFMRQALHDEPIFEVAKPENLIKVRINPETGMYALDQWGVAEWFVKGTEPTKAQALDYKQREESLIDGGIF